MKKKKLLLALVAALAVSQGIPVLAAPATNKPTDDQHTTIGIMEAEKDISQTSFEVPLYITTAAVSNSTKLLCPTGYDIKNTAPDGKIGVVSMTVQKVGDWNTVETAPNPGSKQDVMLTIGDFTLPSVNQTTTQKTVVFSEKKTTCAFYKNNGLTAIPAGETLAQAAGGKGPTEEGYKGLDITGTVSNDTRTNKKAAAQFRITYIVSALDDTGAAIGNTYVGDDKAASGMK